MINENEIDIVRGVSEWDDNTKNYQIPLFTFKDKKVIFFINFKVKFPTLVGHRLVDFVEKEKQNRNL